MPRARPRFDSLEAAHAWADRNKSQAGQKRVTKLAASEEEEQIALIARVRLYEHTYPALQFLFHVPNGGSRNVAEAKKLKAMGTLRGVPDLILLYPARGYHGWLAELKAVNGKATIEQKRMIRELQYRGYFARIFYGQDEVWESLLWYLDKMPEQAK